MSKVIQVRKVPERVHKTLRTRAASAGVSLSDYVLEELKRLAARPPIVDVLTRAAARPGGASTEDIVAIIRAGRER